MQSVGSERSLRWWWILGIAFLVSMSQAQEQNSCIEAYGSKTVSDFLTDLQKSVAADDREHVASLVQFPITITIKGKQTRIRTRAQLLKNYDVAFDAKVKGFLAKQRFTDLFCNWKGIMIGRGEIWLDAREHHPLRIIAINNNPRWSP